LFRTDFIDAKDFAGGLAPVGNGKLWGYIDKSGAVRIPLQYEDAGPFSEGMARVRKDGKWGYIDRSGNVALRPTFETASDFSEGLAVVGDHQPTPLPSP
jgi:hypothetical protein